MPNLISISHTAIIKTVHSYVTAATLVVNIVPMYLRLQSYVCRLYDRHSFPVGSALTNKVANNKLT